VLCAQCGEVEVPEHREKYCSRRCTRHAWLDRQPPHAYHDWQRASKRKSRLKVPPDAEHQAAARLMIERGYCAYENSAGLICDIGEAGHPRFAGRIWSRP
jgi:hypothetical protein